jgi:hypothetical protein
MGAAGRERVRQLFTWERNVARLEELYESVLPGAASAPAQDARHVARTA